MERSGGPRGVESNSGLQFLAAPTSRMEREVLNLAGTWRLASLAQLASSDLGRVPAAEVLTWLAHRSQSRNEIDAPAAEALLEAWVGLPASRPSELSNSFQAPPDAHKILEKPRHDRLPDPVDGSNRDEASERARDPCRTMPSHAGGDTWPTRVDGGAHDTRQGAAASRSSALSWRWPLFAVAGGAVMAVASLVAWLQPSAGRRAAVAVSAAIGLLTTLWLLRRNPAHHYRRMLEFWIAGGVLINALAFTVEAPLPTEWGPPGIRWSGEVSPWFHVSWVIVVAILVHADRRQGR